MKRLIALILACLMPICALADTYEMSISVDTDEQLFVAELEKLLSNVPDAADDPQTSLYIQMIQKLLDGLAVNINLQDDAFSVDVQLGGGSLLDYTFYDREDNIVVTSSLFEGRALEFDIEQPSAATGDADALKDLDWHRVEERVSNCFTQWMNSLEPVVTSGTYVGNTFENGSNCKIWAFEDKDVAALVKTAATGEIRAAAAAWLSAIDLDAATMLADLGSISDKVAEENRYRYLLRAVSDETGKWIALTLTVYDGLSQIATVSLGNETQEYRLVFGFGVEDKNYWCEMTVSASRLNNTTYLSGKCIEWMAEKKMSFPYVKNAVTPVSDQAWYCNIAASDKSYSWEASIYEDDKSDSAYCYSSSGTVIPAAGELDCNFSIGNSPYIPLTLKLKCGPGNEIPALDDTLLRCFVTDPADAGQYQEIIEEMSNRLTIRMIKLMPMDLLLEFSPVGIP